MLDSEKDLHIEAFNLNGSEKEVKFNTAKEALDGDKFWTIREIKLEREGEVGNDMEKMFSFRIDDAAKTLTVDQIKNIMSDEYGYHTNALSVNILGKKNINGTTVCTNNDIIHVILDVRQDAIMRIQNGESIDASMYDYTGDETGTDTNEGNGEYVEDNLEQRQESPYREMIENQTGKIRYGDRSKPELTLTIDDGNSHEDVEAILDILAEENIQTTFFIKGDRLQQNKDLWEKAIRQGHQICCHTYSHIYLNSEGDITDLTTGLNGQEIDITKWQNNVKRLLGEDYYNNLKQRVGSKFPSRIESDLLLETEILMWEEEIRRTLGEAYLQECKINHPFIRLPGGNGVNREKNIAVLKRLGYLSIYWSDDFYNSKRVHQDISNMKVENGGIPLFHFKGKKEQKYIKDYINKAKASGKTFKPLTDIIRPTN